MEIRGVQGAGVLKTLLDRKLIAVAGRKNVIGKPMLYKTTKEFLIQFGLKDLANSLAQGIRGDPADGVQRRRAPADRAAEPPDEPAAEPRRPGPEPEPPTKSGHVMAEERLQKILSQAGVASRRQAEKIIVEGRVTVNGAVDHRTWLQGRPRARPHQSRRPPAPRRRNGSPTSS